MAAWTALDNDFIRSEHLTIYEKQVYLVIKSHLDNNGVAWPGFGTIAKESSCSKRQAIRAVEGLQRANLIERENNGRGKVNNYRLITSDSQAPVRSQTSDSQALGSDSQALELVTNRHPKKNHGRRIIKKNQEEVRAMSPEDHARLLEVFAPYWEEKEIEDRIAECLAYPFARTKGRNWYLTTRQWLRTETEKQRSRNGQYPNNPSSAVTKRSRAGTLEQWREWEQRQKKGIHASDVPL